MGYELLMANKKVFFLNHLKEKYTFFNKSEGHKIDGLFWHATKRREINKKKNYNVIKIKY